MIVVIIDKTFKDSDRIKGPWFEINKLMPDDHPMSVREEEWVSVGAAKAANPGKTVMTNTAYNTMMSNLHVTHKDKTDLMELKADEVNAAEDVRRELDNKGL